MRIIPDGPRFLDQLRAALGPAGLNAFGVVSAARFDALAPPEVRTDRVHPPARSIVVIGSGGPAHWSAFLDYVAADPLERFARRRHPFDAFAAHVFGELGALTEGTRVVFPTFGGELPLDFMKLAELAGLGRPSELGILIGAAFGPWFGLRAALFTPHLIDETGPVARLCDGCDAPCKPFVDIRARREACIVAPEARYDELERLYHYDRAEGRRRLCLRFQITDEITGPIY